MKLILWLVCAFWPKLLGLKNRLPIREDQLQTLAIEWLLKEFGEDCVHARVNRDEEAYRIHAVIVHG
jgi:hypothetical protein